MKRTIKYIVSCVAGVLMLSGCNSLDQAPTNKFTDDGFWKSPDRAQMVLNMAYSQMYSHGKIWDDEALSDNLYEQRGNPSSRVIRTGQATPSTALFKDEWKWLFEGIKTCNVFMGKVDLVPNMDEALKDRMKSEIRFIRTYLYFRMTNFYGDIPFFLKDVTLEQSRHLSRTKKSEVIPVLIEELETIIPMLPSRNQLSGDENGKITKAAAMVLLARIYLYDNKMDKVAEICDKLIHDQGTYGTYSLFQTATKNFSAYENLFTSAYEYNSEVILDYSAMETVKQWSTLYSQVPISCGANLTQKAPTRELVDDYLNIDGTLPASGDVTYSNRDPRLTATVVYNGFKWYELRTSEEPSIINIRSGQDQFGEANNTPTGYYTRKYYDPEHGLELKMWTNIIMMRYADVLLMYAEAKQAIGEFDATVWDETIKPIRERAGFLAKACEYPSGVTGDAMRDLIRRERRCELALEGLRYYDLLRWDLARTLLNGPVMSAAEFNRTIDSRSYSDRDRLWSLPQEEMDLVPSLKPNNSGY